MTTPSISTRLLAPLATAAVAAIVATGCGTSEADTAKGRSLFVQQCGQCHVLAQAATTGKIGPNLDAAFAAGRAAGQDSDTIKGVVSSQIAYPRPGPANAPDNPAIVMPANLVTGQDAEDVAAYVGEVAGVPGAAPPKVPGGPGAQVFANNGCAGCHALAAANAGGVVGPSLDDVIPGQAAAQISQSIVDPEAQITQGFPSGVMPETYDDDIPPDQLKQLVDYLISATKGN